jgi:hypothetical protein
VATELTITINFGDERERALQMYCHLTGIKPKDLINVGKGTTFSGMAEPSLFTLLRPAAVRVKEKNPVEPTRTKRIPVLIDLEGDDEELRVLGTFIRYDENVAMYRTYDREVHFAPADCVTVRYVEIEA